MGMTATIIKSALPGFLSQNSLLDFASLPSPTF